MRSRLMDVVAFLKRHDGFWTAETIALEVGCSKSTVYHCLRRLVRAGVVKNLPAWYGQRGQAIYQWIGAKRR